MSDPTSRSVCDPSAYAGEISPTEAWRLLTEHEAAKLIDVRTQAEWSYVGLPDLSALTRQPLLVQWQIFPTMARNEAFAEQLSAHGAHPDDLLLFICRSGVRSKAAAQFMTALGFGRCFNVTDGFEGPHDEAKHRGSRAGWKAAGLPWVQG
ncbi:MAG: rhodanese-like domain-containing protein [Actinomycetota bacterium]